MATKTVMAHRSVGHPVDAAHETSRVSSASPGWPAVAGHDKRASFGQERKVIALARSWIGTPYVHQASVKGAGCDCLGLLRGVWRELVGEEPEKMPPYSADWAEASGEETLYMALARHLREIPLPDVAGGDIALFRMARHGPAKHCGIVGEEDGGLSLIHARQNHCVSEELFTRFWQRKLVFAFRL